MNEKVKCAACEFRGFPCDPQNLLCEDSFFYGKTLDHHLSKEHGLHHVITEDNKCELCGWQGDSTEEAILHINNKYHMALCAMAGLGHYV